MRRGDMSSNIPNPIETLQMIEQKWSSYARICTTLKRIAEECHSFCMVLDGYRFSEGSCSLGTVQMIEEDWVSFIEFSDKYLSKLSHLCETLKQTEDECSSFHIFLSEESDSLDTLWQHIRRHNYNFWQTQHECRSLLILSKKYLSSEESLPIKTLQRIKDECDSLELDLFAVDKFKLMERKFKFLKRDLKLLDTILNLQIFTGEPDLIRKVQPLFQGAAADLIQIYRRQGIHQLYRTVSVLQKEFWQTKLEIRKAKYSFSEVSCRLLVNNDATVIPNFVLEFIDTVIENLSDSLMYARTCTRLDISFAVGMLGRYQSNPGIDYWKAAKKVLRYLKERKITCSCIGDPSIWKLLDIRIQISMYVLTLENSRLLICSN